MFEKTLMIHTLAAGFSTVHGLIRANPCCGPSFHGPKLALTIQRSSLEVCNFAFLMRTICYSFIINNTL